MSDTKLVAGIRAFNATATKWFGGNRQSEWQQPTREQLQDALAFVEATNLLNNQPQ